MWRRPAIWCNLLVLAISGCATSQPTSISWLERFRPFQGPTGPDVVQIDVALLQRPLTDAYLSRDLWASADEQAISLETKIVLEENGFRVGQIGGLTPAPLQNLLCSKRINIDPRRLFVRANNSTPLSLGPKMASCRLQIHQDGHPETLSFEQAECQLSVVPLLGKDGIVKLRFTPRIQHGSKTLEARAVDDQSGFLVQAERPTHSFANLSWEVTLAPNQYLVVGGRFDRPDSLGNRCFLRGDEPAPVQRLLVIRANRGFAGPLDDGLAATEDPQPIKSPPLALQAAWTSARGTSN
jgi:hypothetical protein